MLRTQQRLAAIMNQKVKFDCSHCHAKGTEVLLYTQPSSGMAPHFQLRESEIGGNCSECGIFVLVDAGRERVVSQAIRPLAPLKASRDEASTNIHLIDSLVSSGCESGIYTSISFQSETSLNEVL
jgi:hypothetical protein